MEVAHLSRGSLQIVRRTNSAPIIPETTFFGSWKRGSFTSARISLTGQSAFVRLSNAQLPFKGSWANQSAKQKGSPECSNAGEKQQRHTDRCEKVCTGTLLTADEDDRQSLSTHLALRESVDQTGMLRKPPKKVVGLAGYKSSDKCTGES